MQHSFLAHETLKEKPAPTLDQLSVGHHVCALYETRNELYESSCGFLKTGLARQEKCVYITEQLTPAEFIFLLAKQGVDAKNAIAKGSLQVLAGAEVRDKLDGFTPEKMLSFLILSEQKAKRDGFTAFRWAADMTWLKQDNISTTDFFSYEAKLNNLLQEHDLIGLCQYSKEDFKSDLLIAASQTHPLFVYNQFVCTNHYYIPPEEFLKPTSQDMQLERIIGNIVSREVLIQTFLSSKKNQ